VLMMLAVGLGHLILYNNYSDRFPSEESA